MYKRTEERYAGGGLVKYVVYQSPQPLRNGRVQQRTRVKRVYLPADATNIKLEGPAVFKKTTGRKAHGVAVRYRYQLAPARARRGRTSYELPERWAERRKIIELPKGARGVRLTDKPPEGPLQAVA